METNICGQKKAALNTHYVHYWLTPIAIGTQVHIIRMLDVIVKKILRI